MTVSPENLITLPTQIPALPGGAVQVGVLALQGAFAEHMNMLRRLGLSPVEVRLPAELAGLDGLIIPGGESTVIGKLAVQFGLMEPLREFIAAGQPVWGTCAGLIFLAKEVGATGSGGHIVPPRLAVMDVTVNRNAFGRQVESFEADLSLTFAPSAPFRALFIRAPRIEAVGEGVEILARLPDDSPVAARQNNLLGTAFHPELTADPRIHQYFLQMITEKDG